MTKGARLIACCILLCTLSAAAEPERLSLDQAVQRALQRNSSLLVARADIQRAQAVLRQVRAGSLPSLTGTASYTRTSNGGLASSLPVVGVNQVSVYVDLNVPLLLPSGWARWLEARDEVGVAHLEAEQTRRQVAAATAHAYLLAVARYRLVDVAQRARDVAAAHRDFAHQRFVRGVGNRLDELRAAEELAADEVQLQASLVTLAQAREALGVLVAGDAAVDTLDQVLLDLPPGIEAADGGQRSDLQALQGRAQAARRAVSHSFADYLPQLGANLTPFYQYPATSTLPEFGWQAQLVLTVPLFDGGRRSGAAREREALLARALAQLQGTTRRAQSEIRAAAEAVLHSAAALVAAQARAQTAHETLRLANVAYQAGATSNIEVIDAVRRARDAEVGVSQTQDAAVQARLDLLVAAGLFPGVRSGAEIAY